METRGTVIHTAREVRPPGSLPCLLHKLHQRRAIGHASSKAREHLQGGVQVVGADDGLQHDQLLQKVRCQVARSGAVGGNHLGEGRVQLR